MTIRVSRGPSITEAKYLGTCDSYQSAQKLAAEVLGKHVPYCRYWGEDYVTMDYGSWSDFFFFTNGDGTPLRAVDFLGGTP